MIQFLSATGSASMTETLFTLLPMILIIVFMFMLVLLLCRLLYDLLLHAILDQTFDLLLLLLLH